MARRKLAANVHVPASGVGTAKFFAAGSSPEKEYAEQITNDKAWVDDEGDENPTGYRTLSKPELEAEVDRRNAERAEDDRIEVGGKGNKPDLVDALEADDEAQA